MRSLLAGAPPAAAEELHVCDFSIPYLPGLQVERHIDLDLQAVAPVVIHNQAQRRRLPSPGAVGVRVPVVEKRE